MYPGATNLGHRLRTGQTATDDCLGDAHRILTLAKPQLVVFSSSSFLPISHSHVGFLYHFTCCFCRTFPAPSATTSLRLSFQCRQFTTTGTHGLTTFGQIGITFYLSCCALNFHCFDACKLSNLHVIITKISKKLALHLRNLTIIKLSSSPYQSSFSSFAFMTHHYIFIKHSRIGYHELLVWVTDFNLRLCLMDLNKIHYHITNYILNVECRSLRIPHPVS
jgi:hypothetical protein